MSETSELLEIQELEQDDFERALTRKYDVVMIKDSENPVYSLFGTRCDTCDEMESCVYVKNMEVLTRLEESGVPIASAALGDEYDDSVDGVGFVVCTKCGHGNGADLRERDVIVVSEEDILDYISHRKKVGGEL